MDLHRDVAVISELLEHLSRLDVAAMTALLTHDVVLELPLRGDGGPRRLEGADALRFIGSMPKLFSTLVITDALVQGPLPSGQVVAEYRSDGSTRTGRPYRNSYVALFTMRDGRVAHWREYFDPTVIAAAFAP